MMGLSRTGKNSRLLLDTFQLVETIGFDPSRFTGAT